VDAIFYILRTGCPWRYLPSDFPPWPTVVYHFRRFRLHNVWHPLYTALHRAERERVSRHPDPSAAILDSQSVKTVEESARIRGYDAHKCVKGRKRRLLVDTLGQPIAWYVTPADLSDLQGAQTPWRACVLRAAAQEDLGGCRLPWQGVGGTGRGHAANRQRAGFCP
jgi:putative transposase